MTADDIYVRAVAAARAQVIPAYVTYHVAYAGTGATITCPNGHVVVSFRGKNVAGSYRVSYRSSDAAASSTNLETNVNCLGTPLIDPTGGDIAKLLDRTGPPAVGTAAAPPGATIATVRVSGAFHYAVLAAVAEKLEDTMVYHLTLRALRDPATYPLTDLYVDSSDFAIRRIVGTFVDRFGGVPATIVATGDFVRVGAYWMQAHEHVEFSAETQPDATKATLDARASDFSFPSEAPAAFR